jgi:hypothetical protein
MVLVRAARRKFVQQFADSRRDIFGRDVAELPYGATDSDRERLELSAGEGGKK